MKKVEIKNADGSVGLYIDGKKVTPVFYALSDIPGSASNTYYAYKNIKNFGELGINLVSIDTELRDGWYKSSPYEWESMQEEIAAAQIANPNAKVLIRLHLDPPYWWLRDFPEEQLLFDGVPGVDDGEESRLLRSEGMLPKRIRVSLASERWRKEAGERLRLFCENIWNTPEGEAIVAIQVACGLNGEWHQWGTDTSLPMQRRFMSFIREKYMTDEELQAAWGMPDVTLTNAPFCPSPKQPKDEDGFRDPAKSRHIMDAQYCIQSVVAEDIIYFCEIVKESFARPVLAGAFYGYYLGPGGKNEIYGHLVPNLVYERRDVIDFLCGPFPYRHNRQPEYMPMQRGLLESTRLRGMLWLTEVDERPAGIRDFPHGAPDKLDVTVSMLRRCSLMPIVSGQGFWYYDHRGPVRTPEERAVPGVFIKMGRNKYCNSIYRKFGWWDTPELLSEIGKMQRIYGKYTLNPYKPAADVLFVYTPESYFVREDKELAEYFFYDALYRTGVAYDCIYIGELALAEMDRYKAVIFMDAYYLTDAQRKLIKERTKGKEVLFMYASGYADEKSLSLDGIRDITGMKVCKTEPQKAYRVTKTDKIYEVYAEEPTPYFAVEDKDAEILATYEGSRLAAAAKKEQVWYFSMLKLDYDIALDFIKASGAHRYTDSKEAVFAGAGLVALHTVTGGERKINFRNGKVISVTLPPNTTAIFDAETGERLDV
ncbi:MAG: hypothetical protein E7612_04630 [Ruminococcaceae bacterium]|nr:hypothetical protein [Oscillospiraceae bacterium]